MTELRCEKCNRLLGKTITLNGFIEIKCTKCGHINKFKFFGKDKEVKEFVITEI